MPQTSRRALETSPTVARAASASFIGHSTLSVPAAAAFMASRALATASLSRSDRSVAKVFFTVLEGEAQVDLTRKALGRAAGFLRTHLGKHMKLRRVPELRFMPDESLEEGNRINELFAKIKEEEAQRPPAPPEEEGQG